MAKKKGWVTEISERGWAEVVIDRGGACNNCEASQFCHSIADCSKIKIGTIKQRI
jgi:positive regulator of sigma E activity